MIKCALGWCAAVAVLVLVPACGGGGGGSSPAAPTGETTVPGGTLPPPSSAPDGITYEPIPADPDIFYDGAPPNGAWDTHWDQWDGTYEDWQPSNSDWANTQSEWEEADLLEQPEPALNCDICEFPRSGIYCIMQNDGHGDAKRSAELRKLAKMFLRRSVLESRGQIHDYWMEGTLAAVEFDWFFPEVGNPEPDEMLPTVGQVYGIDEDGLPLLIANVYCYNGEQFAARVKAVEAQIGHTMGRYTVWEDNTLTSTDAAATGAQINSGQSVTAGPLTSLADVEVDHGYHVMDAITYGGEVDLRATVEVDDIAKVKGVTTPAVTLTVEWARYVSKAFGAYFPGDVTLTSDNPPADGVIFAEGDITITATGMTGKWTFVSATGNVRFQGNTLRATAWLNDMLALSYVGDVYVGCHQSTLFGEICAPLGEVELHATDMTHEGIVHGASVRTTGGQMLLTDGTDAYVEARK